MTTFFTIATSNYRAQVEALASSIVEFNKEATLYWIVSDNIHQAETAVFIETIYPSQIIDDLDKRHALYDTVELATSLKFPAMKFFVTQNEGPAIYLDPDTFFLRDPSNLSEVICNSDFALTPHWCGPEEISSFVAPEQLRRVGVYNLGFLAANNTENAICILDWLSNQTKRRCLRLQEEGIFVDQTWADYIVSFADRVQISRDKRLNTAWWNGQRRNWSESIFVHFSGYNPNANDIPSRHVSELTFDDLHKTARKVFTDYDARISECTQQKSQPIRNDLTPLKLALRRLRCDCSLSSTEEILKECTRFEDHPFESVLGQELLRSVSIPTYDCYDMWKSVLTWLETCDKTNSHDLTHILAWWRDISNWVDGSRKICVDTSKLIEWSGNERDPMLPFAEKCRCGRAKPGRFS